MGANQSSSETRSVTMDNPNPTPSGVIDVSDEVVQRLKLGISKVKQQEKREAKTPETSTRAVPTTESKQSTPTTPPLVQKSAVAAAAVPKTSIYSNPTLPPQPSAASLSPYPRLAGEPVITAMEMRRQKEIELRENDQIWRTRMSQLEQTLNKTNAVMEKEYSAAVEDVRKRFMNASGTHQLPPCQDLKAQLIACYRAYPGETLRCAEEVAMFRNCVAVHRIKRLDEDQVSAAKGA